MQGQLLTLHAACGTYLPMRLSDLLSDCSPLLHTAKSFWQTSTVYSADSVEFSPHHPSVLAIGTYQIETPAPAPPPPPPKDGGDESSDEESGYVKTLPAKRKGRCLVYGVEGQEV